MVQKMVQVQKHKLPITETRASISLYVSYRHEKENKEIL